MEFLKKKTTYILMGTIVGLTVVLFAVISFFHLQSTAIKAASTLKAGGKPSISSYIVGGMSSPLDKPMDVTKVGNDIYVSDTNHQQIQVFDSSGKLAFKFGSKGSSDGQFLFPYGIAGDKKGNIYVADLYNGKISIFTSKGKFIKYFAYDTNNASFLASPAGLRIYNNDLFVTDIKTNRVLEYSLSGEKVLELTTATAKDDTLNAPNAVTIDADKNIYVSDTGNQRIVVYDKKGKFIRIINGTKDGKGDSKFVNPRGVGVQPNGTLLMVDNMTHFIYGFDKNGKQKFQFGGIGSDNDQFYLPNGLYVDQDGKVYITDTVNERIAQYN
jgi:DNA-binding beta-propeller fold protein YncE